jgi:3-oxoacyl-[acyl-carrier-protein] synthase III
VVAPASAGPGSPLEADYSQTGLRRIVPRGEGHYRLEYLTAADLIALAGVRVERADLVIVATYTNPPAGPTATPLPEPPPAEELP